MTCIHPEEVEPGRLGDAIQRSLGDCNEPLTRGRAAGVVPLDGVERVAEEVVGKGDVWEAEPMMGAEDFAILAREAPGTFLWVGAACADPREHHNPRFDIDESVLPINAALLAGIATELLLEVSE